MQCIQKDVHVTCAIPCGTSVWNKAGLSEDYTKLTSSVVGQHKAYLYPGRIKHQQSHTTNKKLIQIAISLFHLKLFVYMTLNSRLHIMHLITMHIKIDISISNFRCTSKHQKNY